MKKVLLLAIMIVAYHLLYAQKIYDVNSLVFQLKKGGTISYILRTGDKLTLRVNSEGKGEYIYAGLDVYHEGTEDYFTGVNIEPSQIKDVSDEIRASLMDFYYATDGPNWLHNEGWGEEIPVQLWYGVDLGKSLYYGDYIHSLRLGNNNLSGTIPLSIKSFPHLKILDLEGNNLTGTLPSYFSSLTDLEELNISDNQLSGDFPEHPFGELMNQVSNSTHFRFYGNNFNQPLPTWIRSHEKFWEYWPDFCYQKSFEESNWDWGKTFGEMKLPGPKYILTDFDGNIHKYSEDYQNNNLTILYQWASWCPYSKAFTPKLVSAYEKYKDVGLKILGIVDYYSDTEEDVSSSITNLGITWPNISEICYYGEPWDYNNPQYNEKNNVVIPMRLFSGTPKLFAINQQGELVLESFFADYDDLLSLIKEMFGPFEEAYYTSNDYSHDGEVLKLQTATIGKGIDIVFLGEAFVDKDMETDGKYEQKMRLAMEQFFSIEPYTSLRDRFNVYAVKVVSPNAEFASDAKHALNEDNSKVFEYAQKAVGENAERMLVGVVYNTDYRVGRSFCNMYLGDGSFVAYLKEGVNSTLNHEMGGHGIAQLLDEYVENGNEDLTLPEESKMEMEEIWQKYGAGANVDYHNNVINIKWSHFINDTRYHEKVGIYEGAYLYGHGTYRPSENSMMRYNDSPFNAPSRESIYKHVMSYSENNWIYDYENFVTFDTPIREVQQQLNVNRSQTKNIETDFCINTLPPIIYKGTWK